jgi:hypothetical protein
MGKRDLTKIITGSMIAQEKGCIDHRDAIRKIYADLSRGSSLAIDLIEEIDTGNFVLARVDHGRWGANCECGGAEYVDPDDPVFYCFSCGNAAAGGKLRPVQFPGNMEDIELLLLERPVSVHRGITMSSINLNSRPLKGANRDWDPEDTDLEQAKALNRASGLEDDLTVIKERP